MPLLTSKLADQGVTIFSTMSALAQELGALNLSQGFPDFPAPLALIEALCEATREGYNQYSAGDGWLPLRQQVSAQFKTRDQCELDPFSEITITPGATIGIFAAIQAFIHTDDEVIVFDPSYDSYAPAIRVAGGRAVHIALQAPDFAIDWDEVASYINSRTKMVIVNTPHNPTGTIWSQSDWQQLIQLCLRHDLLVLSDEVYEHLVFDGQTHLSAMHFPELRERSFVVGSFGKTFHVTGWKTGYCVAAEPLMRLFRQIYQYANFCGNTPAQVALSHYMQTHPEHIQNLSAFYQAKRDRFNAGLSRSGFSFIPAQGTFFQTVDYAALHFELNDTQFCQKLAHEHGIVAIPLSVFYQAAPSSLRQIRFCFAKNDQTLDRAVELLSLD